MRLKRYLFPAVFLAAIALVLVTVPDASAQQTGLKTAAGIANLKNPGIPALIGSVIKALLAFVGTLFLLLMLYAGFLWMTARGDSAAVDKAKGMITGAIIGVLIIASAYAITELVLNAATGVAQPSAEGEGEGPPPAAESVPVGGNCTSSDQCTPNPGTVCGDDGKCVSIF